MNVVKLRIHLSLFLVLSACLLMSCSGEAATDTLSRPTAGTPSRVMTPTSVAQVAAMTSSSVPHDVQSSDSTPSTGTSNKEVVVIGDDSAFGAGCRAQDVAQVVMGFLDAFNRGEQTELGTFIGQAFQWYSVTEGNAPQAGRHTVVRTKTDVLMYFAQRHQQHERIQLQEMNISYEESRNLAHIGYVLTRYADDLEPKLDTKDNRTVGKGAISCTDQTIVVWSMGTDLTSDQNAATPSPTCPNTVSDQPVNVIRVCVKSE
jgi:hypothetical protein